MEIKFRGRKIDSGEWLYGGEYEADNKKYIVVNAYDNPIALINEVVPKTVGQFVGVKDKNGAYIYENDILQDEEDGKKFIVVWNRREFCLISTIDYDEIKKYSSGPFIDDNSGINMCKKRKGFASTYWRYKVIGNIFNNPRLLRDEK